MKPVILGWMLTLMACRCLAVATIDLDNSYAYGANIGWINAAGDRTNGMVVGQAFCSGYLYGANVGWIHLGDGSPPSGIAYDNTAATDYGVNHDGMGNLAGYAYGANIGWINFEQTYGKPHVDLTTGILSGYAWGANVGWISLSNAYAHVRTAGIRTGPDEDGDGIPDAWEYGHTNDLAALNGGDADGDGVSDYDEYVADTDPFDAGEYFIITDFQAHDTTNEVTWTVKPTRLYTLLHASALNNGSSWIMTSSSFVPPYGPEVTETVTGVLEAERFYRVRVGPPLSRIYPVVDTSQMATYDATNGIAAPAAGSPFAGQDAQYEGSTPVYTISNDGYTVYDEVTGLTWTRSCDWDHALMGSAPPGPLGDGDIMPSDKMPWSQAVSSFPSLLNTIAFGGFSDWRLPSIKELYSLFDARGIDPSGNEMVPTALVIPNITAFINTNYFEFGYGGSGTMVGSRLIDAQFWSSTEYVSTTMYGDATVFGVNFADGRIKGYPKLRPSGSNNVAYAYFVRGNPKYGINDFMDNGDGTVSDWATGLMWQQADSGTGLTWQAALDYAENLTLAGYDDWRLPNTKELQAIIDYSRSPATDGTAAIDPVFNCSSIFVTNTHTNIVHDFPFYWTSTTHESVRVGPGTNVAYNAEWAMYLCFGTALGYVTNNTSTNPPYLLLDVHGAGSQRSDPKAGLVDDYVGDSGGHGPQGDIIRIKNHVRCVRGGARKDF